MTHPDAEKWNARYAADGAHWQNGRPRQLLRDFAHLLPESGLALDAAAGVGLHALFLAQRGLHVIALDISEVGLRLARQQARAQGLRVETAVVDLARPWFPPNCFDVIVNFRFLERAAFAVYRRALRPGGLLIFETFVRTPQVQQDRDYYLQPGELRAAFAGWQIVHAVEKDENGRSRPKRVAQLVARRPA